MVGGLTGKHKHLNPISANKKSIDNSAQKPPSQPIPQEVIVKQPEEPKRNSAQKTENDRIKQSPYNQPLAPISLPLKNKAQN